MSLTAPPDGTDRIFVVEQDGVIRSFDNDATITSSHVFLDIRSQVSRAANEEGLLGFAFHPGYASNGMNALGVLSQNPIDPGGVRLLAGNKEQSELWQRLRRRDSFGMPPLSSMVIDQAAIDLIGEWLDSGAGNL